MTRTSLLVLSALVCGASLVHAQNGQVYYANGAYPPTSPAPNMYPGYYGNPHAYRQPIQPAQYPSPYYGQYPNRGYTPAPAYYQARPSYPANNYGYNNGYGVNYYYMKNPVGYSPTPAPYSAVATNRAIGKPMSWPSTLPDTSFEGDLMEAPGAGAPEKPFHRLTNERWWVSSDYVGMFIRPMRLAGALVTTGSAANAAPGALGQASTAVLFGREKVDYNLMSGVRAEAGLFLDDHDRFSIELAGFIITPGKFTYNIAGDANGNPVIARPVFNVASGLEGGFVNSVPGTVTGTFKADFRTDMAGAELNARYHDYVKERLHIDGLLGFRYLRLAERMQLLEQITPIQANFLTFQGVPIQPGETLVDDDVFRTTNQFFGPQIGARLNWEHKWLNAAGFAKLGMGVTHQQTTITGTTTVTSPNGNRIAQGGILALPSNIGTHSRTVFGILPEFGFNLGVELHECIRLKMGYSLLLWNHVVRAGSQFDRNVNPGQVPGSPTFGVTNGPFAPIYRFNEEFFWAHSFNLGLEFHF